MPARRTLLVLSSDPGGPVVRHRFLAYREALGARGIDLEVVAWTKRRRDRRDALERVARAGATVVASRLLSRRDVRRLRERSPRLGFDFDDALPYRDSRRGAAPSRTRAARFAAIVRAADRVTAGNAHLVGLAAARGVAATLLPTTVDVPERPPPFVPVVGGETWIGWIGSRATLPYLEQRAVVFAALVASGRRFRVRVVADGEPAFPPGIAVDAVPWTEGGWREALAAAHLGIAPLSDDAWTRGKCGLRLLQTLAVARPCVAGAVGVQQEQIRHGETGWLARDAESYLAGLLTLLDDEGACRRMGEAGHLDVRERWSVAAWAPRVADECEALLA